METDKTTERASILTEEMPVSALTRLIAVVPSTSMFAGWGPRMETTVSAVLRARN